MDSRISIVMKIDLSRFYGISDPALDSEVIRVIRDWVKDAPDSDLFRINLVSWSKAREIDLEKAILHFLHLTVAGIFELSWEMHCPYCNVVLDRASGLGQVHPGHYCQYCLKDVESRLDDYFEVTFTVSPAVREVRGHVRYEPSNNVEVLLRCKVGAGAEEKFPLIVPDHVHQLRFVAWPPVIVRPISIKPGHADATVTFRGGEAFETPEVIAGRTLELLVSNRTDRDGNLMIEDHEMREYNPDEVAPRLSGLRLVSSPAFRELFSAETLSERESLSIREVTVAFTDIVGSTELYRSVGDIKAYTSVRDHFEVLFDEIHSHGGTVVKTIGDSVMATFLDPREAIASITSARNRLVEQGLRIRAGIHRGPALVVTLNGRLDYFGTTINEAARCQGSAENDIVLSESVYSAADGIKVIPFVAELKGLGSGYRLYRVA